MKKILILAAAGLLSSAALASTTNTNNLLNHLYVNGNLGLNMIGGAKNDYDTGWGLGVAVGRYITPHFRAEGAFNYLRNGTSNSSLDETIDAHLNQYVFMANGYYDFNSINGFLPYAGGGLGIDHATSSVSSLGVIHGKVSGEGTNFAIQGIVGFDYPINKNVVLGANYHLMPVFASDTLFNNLINFSITYKF